MCCGEWLVECLVRVSSLGVILISRLESGNLVFSL